MLHLRFLARLGTNFIYMWSKQDRQNRVLSRFSRLSFSWKVPFVIYIQEINNNNKKKGKLYQPYCLFANRWSLTLEFYLRLILIVYFINRPRNEEIVESSGRNRSNGVIPVIMWNRLSEKGGGSTIVQFSDKETWLDEIFGTSIDTNSPNLKEVNQHGGPPIPFIHPIYFPPFFSVHSLLKRLI